MDWITMTEGVKRRTLADGEKLFQMLVQFEKHGAKVARHQHPHEQISHIISGRIRFTLNETEIREVGPGESLLIPGNVPHDAMALEPTLVVETFSPPREDLRAKP